MSDSLTAKRWAAMVLPFLRILSMALTIAEPPTDSEREP
jgi:hypothetical protein